MLDWYDIIDECIISVINVDNGMKEPTRGYEYYYTNQILIFGEYLKVKESLYTCVNYLGQTHSQPL